MATQTNKELFLGGFVKVLKEQQEVDVQLKASDSKNDAAISAHKLLLSARSKVFEKLLESDKFKALPKLETITLSDLKHEELEAFVEFLYSDGSRLSEKGKQHVRSLYVAADKYEIPRGKLTYARSKILESDKFKAVSKLETITLSELKHEELEAFVGFLYSDGSMLSEKGKQHVRSLYVAADKFEIPHLRDLCRNHFISALSPTNALDVLVIAQIPFDKSLNDAAIRIIVPNRKAIASSDEFKVFVVQQPDLTVEIMKAIP